MALHKHRDIFLATCLLESIEDENYRFVRFSSKMHLMFMHLSNLNIFIILEIHKSYCLNIKQIQI